ncbi:MAG: carbohydrate kinase family protein [Planctomycetota bacterium]|nr:carbohydrate kinase family protein [Planctomycetota bacterium]
MVGNINLDIKTSVLPASSTLFADGETSVAEIYESLGGGGANTAVAASQLGGRVHFCGCVGQDALGDRLEQALGHFGIVAHLRRKPVATGRSIALTWDNHHRHFLSSLPNNREMTAADIDVPELARAGCRHLYRADIWFAEAMLAGGNAAVLTSARELAIETSLDINWDPEWSRADSAERVRIRKAQVVDILPHVSWAHGNQRELALFTGESDAPDACRFLVDRGCGGVIVHRGARGAAAFTAREGWLEVPATPVTKVVCETGPGDVFSAAFMLLDGLPLRERLQECARIAAAHLQGAPNLIPRLA